MPEKAVTRDVPKDWPTYLDMHTNVCVERDDLLVALEQLVHYVAPTVQSEGRLSHGLSSALVQARAVIERVR